jgi:hypothetical protein
MPNITVAALWRKARRRWCNWLDRRRTEQRRDHQQVQHDAKRQRCDAEHRRDQNGTP